MKKIYKSILGLALLLTGVNINAQVSAYSFTQLSGVYSPIPFTGPTATAIAIGNQDDNVFSNIPIGFNFTFNATTYTSVALNVNGWISMGTVTPGSSYNPISTGGASNVVSFFGNDLRLAPAQSCTTTLGSNTIALAFAPAAINAFSVGDTLVGAGIPLNTTVTAIAANTMTMSANATAAGTNVYAKGSISYNVTGVTPNRVFTIQWRRVGRYNQTTTGLNDYVNGQIKLYETTNVVEVRYGNCGTNNTNQSTMEIGLRGNTNADFNNRSVPTTGSYATSTAGAVNSANVAFNNSVTIPSGQIYRWTPPVVCAGAPAANTVVSTPSAVCLNGSTVLSLATSYSANVSYQWFSAAALAGPYTLIPGATLASYATTALTTNTFYTAVITCTNGPASTTATAVQIVVNPFPTVLVSPTSGTVCSPGTNSVTLNASGAATYSWLPVTGLSSSTGASVNALPSSATVYTVTGTSAAGCNGTATTSIIVNLGVVMGSVTANPASICSGANATLNAVASSPTVTYCQPVYSNGSAFGDYISNVTVNTMTNASGPLATPFYTLYPQSAATTTLVAGNAYTISLQAGTYTFNDLAAWIDYNNNGVLNNPGEKLGEVDDLGATPAIATITFTVPLTALNGTARLRVREMDHSGVNDMDPCATQSSFGEVEDYLITITGGVNPVFNYSWTPSTFLSSTSTASTVANTATATTAYTVTATGANGCSANGAVNLTVNPLPAIAITGSNSVCSGQSVVLTASGANTYTWNTSANTASISATPSVNTTYTAAGTSSLGCVGSATQAVAVNANPTITVAGGTICSGQSFTLSPSGASTYSYSTGPVVTPSVTSSYSVTGTSTAGCVSNAVVASVSVNAAPAVTAVSSTSLLCVGQTASLTASGAATYTWNTTANTTVIAVSPTVTTSYTVTGSTNGCSNTFTISQAVSPCTGINANTASVNGVLVYPNPNTGVFTIELNNGSVKNIEVMDLTGRVILSSSSVNDKVDFNINTLANGVYYVRIQSNNTVDVIKIVKQ